VVLAQKGYPAEANNVKRDDDRASIDVDGSPTVILLNLNYDRGLLRWRKRTILVANFATTEHVDDHLNTF
jgi:hypothetical protein